MTDGASDAALLAAVRDRDLPALRELYARHAPWLTVRLSHRCRDAEAVADALQDTFVAVWQKPEAFRGDGEAAAWLWGIAIRRLVSVLRRKHDVVLDPEPPQQASAPGAEEQVLLSLEYGDLGQALAALSPQMVAVVRAVILDGLTTREAARLLHVPESTVKTRLSRAKVHLRAALVEGIR